MSLLTSLSLLVWGTTFCFLPLRLHLLIFLIQTISNPSLSISHAHLLQPFLEHFLGKKASFYPNFQGCLSLKALQKEKKKLLSSSFFLFWFQPESFRSSLFACSTSSFLQEVFNPNLKVHFQGVFPWSPLHSCLKKSLDSEVGSLFSMSSEELDDTEEVFAQQSPENLDNLGGDWLLYFRRMSFWLQKSGIFSVCSSQSCLLWSSICLISWSCLEFVLYCCYVLHCMSLVLVYFCLLVPVCSFWWFRFWDCFCSDLSRCHWFFLFFIISMKSSVSFTKKKKKG